MLHPANADPRARRIEAIVIGGSAGAIEGLSEILPPLPREFPVPIIVVVHVPPERKNALAELFRARCRMDVKEAEDKEPIRGGTVYFAPPNYHVLIEPEPDRRLSLSNDDPVNFSRPSIDVLFESAADAYGPALLAIVLSGASADGARGVAAICRAGGIAVVQLPDTANAPVMPQAALQASADTRALAVVDISTLVREWFL